MSKSKKQSNFLIYAALALAISVPGATAVYTTESINNIEIIREIPIIQESGDITVIREQTVSQQKQIEQLTEQLQIMQEIQEELEEQAEILQEQEEEKFETIHADVEEILETIEEQQNDPKYQHSHEGIASELRGTNEGMAKVSNNISLVKTDIRNISKEFNTLKTDIENITNEIDNRLTIIENNPTIITDGDIDLIEVVELRLEVVHLTGNLENFQQRVEALEKCFDIGRFSVVNGTIAIFECEQD